MFSGLDLDSTIPKYDFKNICHTSVIPLHRKQARVINTVESSSNTGLTTHL